MARIGFIGLGHMGLPMAIQLIKAGHQVMGFDLQPIQLESLRSMGGRIAANVKEAACSAEFVITMLQTGEQVKRVTMGAEGIFESMPKGLCYIDCSTIDVGTARELHLSAEVKGILAVDAPVSGGVAGASAATLTFMVGGLEEVVLKVQPILSAMGKKVIHAGGAGSGQAAKICNNMMLGISMIAVSEAFILAKTLGLTPQKLYEVVTNASGQCWVMNHYVPVAGVLDNVPANRDYQPGFTAAMMLKDLCLSQHVAEASGVTLPMSERATALYQQLNDSGKAELDFSAIMTLLSNFKPSV